MNRSAFPTLTLNPAAVRVMVQIANKPPVYPTAANHNRNVFPAAEVRKLKALPDSFTPPPFCDSPALFMRPDKHLS